MNHALRAAGAVYECRSASPSLLFVFVAGTIAASAQTPFVPYYNKNRIKYDHFKWHIYTTDHFEIYYYPEIEQHLERVASYAESAYQTGQRRSQARPGLQGPAHPL